MSGKKRKTPSQDSVTIARYMESDNARVRNAVASVTSTVRAAAKHAVLAVKKDRESTSDASDYLDGIFSSELAMSQSEEIEEIGAIAAELETLFNQTVLKQAFAETYRQLDRQRAELKKRQEEIEEKEARLEQIIKTRVANAEAKAKQEITSSRGLFESALQKSEKVFDQNKITRFVCSTITRFQEAFEDIQRTRDVEHVTRLFQLVIEPFQTTKIVADRDGKLTKIITNVFTDDCYQDLFLFFYRYYNELMDIYEKEGYLPSTADELSRIFMKKKKGAEEIIAELARQKRR